MSGLGVLILHGLGGTPHSVLPITAAIHGAGYATVAPTLVGHGTSPTELEQRTWGDWLDSVNTVADELSKRCTGIVVIGQSMGGTLALQLAATRTDVRGVATINAPALPADPDSTEQLEYLIGRGRTMQPAGAADIRDPQAHDSAYPDLPLRSLLEMAAGAALVNALLPTLTMPVMVVSGDHDSVVDPTNSDAIAANVRGPVNRLRLANSAHVAALDLDRGQLCRALLTWLVDLTDQSATAV